MSTAEYYTNRTYKKSDLPLLKLIAKLFTDLNRYIPESDGRIGMSATAKDACRIEKIIEFLELPYKLKIKDYREGIIIINDKIVYSLLNDKFIKKEYLTYRMSWKNKTQKVSLSEFVEKFVLEEENSK